MEKDDIYNKVNLEHSRNQFVDLSEMLERQNEILLAREVVLESLTEHDPEKMNAYEDQLRKSCHAMFLTLASEDEMMGNLKLVRPVMMQQNLSAFITTRQLEDTYTMPTDTYMHIVRYVDPSNHKKSLFYELYLLEHPYFSPQPNTEPLPNDPNLNKKGKHAGLALESPRARHGDHSYIAQLEGTYETLRAFYDIAQIKVIYSLDRPQSEVEEQLTQQPPDESQS